MAKKAAKKTARKSATKTTAKAASGRTRKATAKKTARKSTRKAAKKATRSSAKRERLNTGTDVRYAKRTASGRWSEMDDVGRSQRADRRQVAKKTVRSGYGDQGDRKTTTGRAAKKR